MKLVYTAETLIDGQMIVDLLAQNGVPSLLFNQNAQGGLGELAVTYPEVWVKRNADQSKARRMIDAFENRPWPEAELRCKRCSEWNPETFEICWRCHGALA